MKNSTQDIDRVIVGKMCFECFQPNAQFNAQKKKKTIILTVFVFVRRKFGE